MLYFTYSFHKDGFQLMKVTFLGTNGWYDSQTGNTICTLVETADEYVVLDAGFGIAKLDGLVRPGKPVYIFISHPHIDHICGLHVLNRFKTWPAITILCGDGGEKYLRDILCDPFSLSPDRLKSKVNFVEAAQFPSLPFSINALPLMHSVACYGVRIASGGKVLAYAPDTGLCDNMLKLAHKADLLVAECSYRVGEHNPGWPHMNPEDDANAALKAGAKRLALTHFEAERYSSLKDREAAEASAKAIFPASFACYDGLAVEV